VTDKPAPKYEEVTTRMREDLLAAGLEPHQPFLTDREAVERYGASRITVRRAFAQLEEDGFIYRIRGKGTLIHPNPGRRIRFVAFMGECLVRNGIEPLIIRGAEDTLRSRDTNLIICNVENDPARALQYAQRLVETRIDGVILTPMLTDSSANLELVDYLLARDVPLVLVGRSIPQVEDRVFSVLADNSDGVRQATEHLISLGHRRIAFVRSVEFEWCTALRARYQGYTEAHRQAGLEIDASLECFAPLNELPLVVKRLLTLPDPPTGVVVDNDITLVHFIQTAMAKGISIPGDLSVAGFDDLPQLPTPIPHTTVHVPHYQIGQMAASQLVEVINNRATPPRQTMVPVSLIIRKTTGIAPGIAPVLAPLAGTAR
jgi:GntR family transcriptional regulator, arabinose operon transcriptional repressor